MRLLILSLVLFSFTLTGTSTSSAGDKIPTIKFLVCHSWGYKNSFDEYSDILEDRYPDVFIEGGEYPAPEVNVLISKIIVLVKFVLIGCILTGMNPFSLVGAPTPNLYSWASDNWIYACLMLYFVGHAVEGQLVSTGAFEIYIDDQLIWSKLEKGSIPDLQELIDLIDAHFK